MSAVQFRRGAASTIVALTAVAVSACGAPAPDTADTTPVAAAPETVAAAEVDDRAPAPVNRTESERAFLDELVGSGLPADLTTDTTVEVGIGICQGIADGIDTESVLDHLRPLTTAIAAQSSGRNTAEVGRTLIEASRTHLCP